jgi:alpha,alpha-trehalase
MDPPPAVNICSIAYLQVKKHAAAIEAMTSSQSSAVASTTDASGFVLRYRTGETDDGMSGREGTFLICSFWLVSALAIIGEEQRARDLMERLLRVASPLGLVAEEFDVDTGRHLGNFPQAFSHLALIEAAAKIIVAERLSEFS